VYVQFRDEAGNTSETIEATIPFLAERITGNDGAPMVLIPAGKFQMGSDAGKHDEKPVHTVYLDAFYMDAPEVTNGQYKRFMDATGHPPPAYLWYSRLPPLNHPVVGVSWDDAMAYCEWAGKRLPTEAEWEKAARGGFVRMPYPWGNEISPDDANYKGTGGKDCWKYTAPVMSFRPNGYGLYDMAGNVWEWCEDEYDEGYYAQSPTQNPKGPGSGIEEHVIRGGSWANPKEDLSVYKRDHRHRMRGFPNIGFRCASDIPP
jgi:formylglycine-generating enzyme required for sulfatase activity